MVWIKGQVLSPFLKHSGPLFPGKCCPGGSLFSVSKCGPSRGKRESRAPARSALAFALQTLASVLLLAESGLAAASNEPFPSELLCLWQSWTCWPTCLLIIDIMLHYSGLFQQMDTLLPDRHLPDRLMDNILKKVSSCFCTMKDCNFITLAPAPCWQISATLPWKLSRNLSLIMIS